MSRLEELIEKLCPNGVEYKKISDIAKVNRGKRLTKSQLNDKYMYYVYHGSKDTPLGKYKDYNVKGDTVIVVNTGGIGGVKYLDSDFWCSDGSFYIETQNIINNRFLYHFLSKYEKYFYSQKRVGGVPTIDKKVVENVSIPVPPLEIQCEIVHILDDLTLLSAELSAELKARQKQYEYYENVLLFNDKYKKVKLEELCVVNQGLQIPISQRKKEKAPNRYFYITVQFLKGGNEKYYIENPPKSAICYKDDILVTRTGSTGKIITGVEGCFHNNFFKVTTNEKIYKKYLYYVLNSKYMFNRMLVAASGGTVPDLPHKKFYNLEIPLPSKEEQIEIVEIMEKMYKLCNDISEGLPAEIEARQKQYEYYRDKLLTFKELVVNEG